MAPSGRSQAGQWHGVVKIEIRPNTDEGIRLELQLCKCACKEQ